MPQPSLFLSCQACSHCLHKCSRLICLAPSRTALPGTHVARMPRRPHHAPTASAFEMIHPKRSQTILITSWMVTWLSRKLPLQPVFLPINANAIVSFCSLKWFNVPLLKSDTGLSSSLVCTTGVCMCSPHTGDEPFSGQEVPGGVVFRD